MSDQRLHPLCESCGWRKGGPDCWAGDRCRCGHWEPPMKMEVPPHPSEVDQPLMLRCQHCREEFERPFSEWFYRDRNGPHGWRKWCKACYSEAPSIRARRNN